MKTLSKKLDELLTKKTDSRPWGYGCMAEDLSERSRAIWETLSETERMIISRKCPYKTDRFEAIKKLHQQGIPLRTLAEISGISRSTIIRRIKGIKRKKVDSCFKEIPSIPSSAPSNREVQVDEPQVMSRKFRALSLMSRIARCKAELES